MKFKSFSFLYILLESMVIFPAALIQTFSLYLNLSSPFFLPLFSFHFGFCHHSFLISVIVPLSRVHKCVCIHVILHLCECAYVCSCVCVCPSQPRDPSASHLWRSQQSRKQAPPSAASQQPMGGLVWDYLGT